MASSKPDASERRLAAGAAAVPPERGTFARILVATDGSPFGDRAVEWAREIALLDAKVPREGAPAARVFAVHALAPAGDHDEDVLDVALRALGPRLNAEPVLAFGEPAQAITRLASDVRADLVIVGSHSRGALERVVLGSVSDRVKDDVRASVLIARSPPPPRRILFADDASDGARLAADAAASLTRGWRVPLSIYRADSALATRAGAAIAKFAGDVQADLIVVGSRGRGRLGRAVAGSVSAHLAHHSPASLLIVKRTA